MLDSQGCSSNTLGRCLSLCFGFWLIIPNLDQGRCLGTWPELGLGSVSRGRRRGVAYVYMENEENEDYYYYPPFSATPGYWRLARQNPPGEKTVTELCGVCGVCEI